MKLQNVIISDRVPPARVHAETECGHKALPLQQRPLLPVPLPSSFLNILLGMANTTLRIDSTNTRDAVCDNTRDAVCDIIKAQGRVRPSDSTARQRERDDMKERE